MKTENKKTLNLEKQSKPRSGRSLYERLFINALSANQKSAIRVGYPDGSEELLGNAQEGDPAELLIKDERFFKQVILHGDIGLGEAYFLGYWDSNDLVKSLNWFVENSDTSPSFTNKTLRAAVVNLLGFADKTYHLMRRNTKKTAADNIAKHYDLSNDLYECMLDPTMAYSAAYFNTPDDDLETAQLNKFKMICAKLCLNVNDHLLEIGSGWGGFAVYAAKNYGCKVTTVTISKQQFEHTKHLVKSEKLDSLIEVRLQDFRDIQGKFDKIVSIEMAEALGKRYLKTYFKKVNDLLHKRGIAVLQVINYPESDFDHYMKRSDFIQRHIFPGSELLSLHEISKTLHKTGDLCIYDIESMGLHYAKTLAKWTENFEIHKDEIALLGFDQEFYRKWIYYLAYCETGFMSRYINVVQLVLSRSQNQSLSDYHSFPNS